jgi:PIN domain nuclease of toxin-antitoxin system
VTCLLDTHFVIWITSNRRRLRTFPWLAAYEPWIVSPISLLEIQFLTETGRMKSQAVQLAEAIMSDSRFSVDEVSFVAVVQKSLELGWTRDPFDRLITAHSLVRRIPLCSVDEIILKNHKLVIPEVAT